LLEEYDPKKFEKMVKKFNNNLGKNKEKYNTNKVNNMKKKNNSSYSEERISLKKRTVVPSPSSLTVKDKIKMLITKLKNNDKSIFEHLFAIIVLVLLFIGIVKAIAFQLNNKQSTNLEEKAINYDNENSNVNQLPLNVSKKYNYTIKTKETGFTTYSKLSNTELILNYTKANKNISVAYGSCENYKKDIEELKDKYFSLYLNYSSCRLELKNYKDSINYYKNKSIFLQKEYDELLKNYTTLKAEYDILKKEKEKLEEENKVLVSTINQLINNSK
jgi:hypothetical protein